MADQKLTAILGRADWLWTPDLDMHVPCCSQPKGRWRCGNGPLMDDAILTGDCGEHGEQNGSYSDQEKD